MQKHQPVSLSLDVGIRVSFQDDHAQATGTIKGFIHCLLNGREHAVIEIDHPLPGIVRRVPADTLTPI
ncbi:hypothetical protein ACO0LG_22530 [Undibacterium sp. Ji42W]|uniref:hypothetical protein n=1 Tax=Undibacterium sp. Ji42W TaxID=3413039 RepID=UPI003BF17816